MGINLWSAKQKSVGSLDHLQLVCEVVSDSFMGSETNSRWILSELN